MALKICEDCEKEISTLAVSCPNCGRPNANAGVVTIEKTAKKWKRWDLFGEFLAFLGFLYNLVFIAITKTVTDPSPVFTVLWIIAMVMVVVGILIFIGSRTGRWYHHG